MKTLTIDTAEVFEAALSQEARDIAIKGGRGSGKSHFVAERLIEDAMAEPGESGEGLRTVCIREVQKDLAQSSKALIEAKLRAFKLTDADGFKVFKDVIQAPRDGLFIFKGMNDYTADSIKSLEGFKRGWWEEAHNATQHSINLYRPTMRADGSQMLWTWNPRRKTDPVDLMFTGAEKPSGAVVTHATWKDNPWFTKALEEERQNCLRLQPEQYGHIWDGDYVSVIEGAYFAKHLNAAKAEGRIGKVPRDPLMALRVFLDIGGTGARADAFAMWVAQFIGREVRVLDYYEAVGQEVGEHIGWLRRRGYESANIWLPHDGGTKDKVFRVSYESAFQAAGFSTVVVPNQGEGAATARIEAARRMFPAVWFNKPEGADHNVTPTCAAGLDALGWYHEKKDDKRNIGLGPEHDWASHGADAFGLMAVVHEQHMAQQTNRNTGEKPVLKTNWIR